MSKRKVEHPIVPGAKWFSMKNGFIGRRAVPKGLTVRIHAVTAYEDDAFIQVEVNSYLELLPIGMFRKLFEFYDEGG